MFVFQRWENRIWVALREIRVNSRRQAMKLISKEETAGLHWRCRRA